MNCNICPRKCNVDRKVNIGFCKASNDIKVAKYMLHFWEEPIISGDNGSGAIFFSHCNLKCVYCQNYKISSEGQGKIITQEQFIDIMKELEQLGANNINLVSPTHYTYQIIEALKKYKPKIPIVWNSSGYEDDLTIKNLKDLVDIYLVDMKYMDNNLAFNLSKAEDYPEVCKKAILQMRENQPKDIIKNGIMQKGVIIRHLVLPNEIENSFKVLDWIYENFGENIFISIMGQYTPCYQAINMQKYNRVLKPIEYKRVINHVKLLGFNNGFFQELDSANSCYIPNFDKFKD